MTYQEFTNKAENLLLAYVEKCVENGGLQKGWLENHDFEEHISNENNLKPTDRVEIFSNISSDTRYSVHYNSTDYMLTVIDTSC